VFTTQEMKPEEFHEWRKALGLTQAEAAQRLGVSKRSIFTYEGTGPVPKTVALACAAIASDVRISRFLARLVKEQHPKLGENVLVLPFVIERESVYANVIEVAWSEEVKEWAEENTPSAQFSFRTVITPDMRRRQVAVVVFENDREPLFFKLRWE
jgi:transcriptional regulator with XRE-family HTH domain